MSISGVNVQFPYLDSSETQPDYETFFSYSEEIRRAIMLRLLENDEFSILKEITLQSIKFPHKTIENKEPMLRLFVAIVELEGCAAETARIELENELLLAKHDNQILTLQHKLNVANKEYKEAQQECEKAQQESERARAEYNRLSSDNTCNII